MKRAYHDKFTIAPTMREGIFYSDIIGKTI